MKLSLPSITSLLLAATLTTLPSMIAQATLIETCWDKAAYQYATVCLLPQLPGVPSANEILYYLSSW
jgi:hypothetical protein